MLIALRTMLNALRKALTTLRAMLFVLQLPRDVQQTHLFASRLTHRGLGAKGKFRLGNAHKKKFYKPTCLCLRPSPRNG
jgi:hypothetical protein